MKTNILTFVLPILLCGSAAADTFVPRATMNNMTHLPGYVNPIFHGAYPAPTGVTGATVQACNYYWTSSGCSYYATSYGAQYYMQGSMITMYDTSPPALGGSSCYVRGTWEINSSKWPAQVSWGVTLQSMGETISGGVSTAGGAFVGSAVKLPYACDQIPAGMIPSLQLPITGGVAYINLTERNAPNTQGGGTNVYLPGNVSVEVLSIYSQIYFSPGVIFCSTEAISSSTCAASVRSQNNAIDAPNTALPITPTSCEIQGDVSINFGSVHKSNYHGLSQENMIEVTCSRSTTLTISLLSTTVENGGVSVKMSVNSATDPIKLPVEKGRPESFTVKAEISNIEQSTKPADYELHNVLLVTYN